MIEFEVGQKVEYSEGEFVITEKIPANPGFFNYVLKNKAGTSKKMGGTVLNMFVEKEKARKLLTGVPLKKWRAKRNNSKTLGLPVDEEVKACDTELYFSLGFYAKNGTLNIRTVTDTDRDADRDYYQITGERLGGSNYFVDNTPSTWATKLWLNLSNLTEDLKEKLFVPPNTEGNKFVGDKFYNNYWIWQLIRDFGFRLGNQDVELILAHIYCPKNKEDFMKGYNA
jgi:hypothetical protein